jgi:predicted DNA-binding protein
MASDNQSPILSVRLGADLKTRWRAYCQSINKEPSTAIKEAIERQLAKVAGTRQPSKVYRQTHEAQSAEKKKRFEILLTPSEKAALLERAAQDGSAPRRWVVAALRAGLTKEPQFGMRELDALGESNYQLLAIGRNLNQIAKRLNEGGKHGPTIEAIEQLRTTIRAHTDQVSQAMRASLERWDLK